uniref:Alternative protein NAALAD2 n=1 Tax=Homo sapiens TaxID=9606 RepID=L8EAF7_HUMAN|nr:alternative protein NAALAD2 [Homo sapiens]
MMSSYLTPMRQMPTIYRLWMNMKLRFSKHHTLNHHQMAMRMLQILCHHIMLSQPKACQREILYM